MKQAVRTRHLKPVQAGFFSEHKLFDVLKGAIYPSILKDRAETETVRVWVPGCSTGEEAYSHAIALLEYLQETRADFAVQIFATDLNEADIVTARWGIYPERVSRDIGSIRLQRFFTAVKGGYRINKRFRDMCVFARQDICNDPPFSRIDLVSCRNVLSAMSRDVQQQLLRRLHYALKPGGFLILGNGEGLGAAQDELFEIVDSQYPIFRKKPVFAGFWSGVERRRVKRMRKPAGEIEEMIQSHHPVQMETAAERLLLTKYLPAAVVVDEDLNIVHTRGNPSRYVRFPSESSSVGLLPLVPPALRSALKEALRKARQKSASIRKENVLVGQDGTSGRVNLEIVPIEALSGERSARCFLIVFEDLDRFQIQREPGSEDAGPSNASSQLRRELEATKEYLQATIDRQAESNELLLATNEEILSRNEELLSTNEELRTTNEELQAVKSALEEAGKELTIAWDQAERSDLQLMQAKNEIVNVPLVILGKDLSVRRYTAAAESALGLGANDIGLPITDLPALANVSNVQALLNQVITDGNSVEQEVQAPRGTCYRLRITPYRTSSNHIEGAVLTLMDISDLKRLLGEVTAGRAKLEETFRLMQSGLVVTEAPSGKLQMANERLWEILGEDMRGESSVLNYATHALDSDGFPLGRENWAIARSMRGEVVRREEIEWRRADGQHLFLAVNSSPVRDNAGTIVSVVATFIDLTHRRNAEEMLRVSEQMAATGRLSAALAHEINNPLEALTNLCYLIAADNAISQQSRNYVNMARTELDRISHISRSLLGLYHSESKTESFLVREVINDVLEVFATRIMEKKIQVFKHYEAEGVMHGSYTELRQVFLNLVGNALEAMEPKGILSIRTSASRNWRDLGVRGFRISVSDNGSGIPPELRSRLFEPFFTTKGTKGTGLGLWVSKGIIHRYGGTIRVRSQTGPGKSGTVFSIFLPNSTVKRSVKSRANPASAASAQLPPPPVQA